MSKYAIFIALLTGCASRSPMIPDIQCKTHSMPLSEAAWGGPTEEAVLAEVAGYEPTQIVWDEYSVDGTTSSSLSILPIRTAEEALFIEASSGPCPHRPGPSLVLPMSFQIDVGDGAAVGEVPGILSVGQDDPTIYVYLGIYPDDTGVPIALDTTWEAAAASSFEGRGVPSDEIDAAQWAIVVSLEPWDGAKVEIDFWTDSHSGVLWRGHWAAGEGAL